MNKFLNAYTLGWTKTFTLGRSNRREYLTFVLMNLLIVFLLALFDGMTGSVSPEGDGTFSSIFNVITIIPSITIGIRRLHDIDYRGWWILFPFSGFIFPFIEGTPTTNRFGEYPTDTEMSE